MKVFIAIAAYDRKLACETARSLLNEQAAAIALGSDIIDLEVGFAPGCCALHYTRDILARNFLRSDCERLVFVDNDVAFEAGDLIKTALRPQEIVGVATRLKKEPEQYPVIFAPTANGQLWADPQSGLLEVVNMPAGFLAISRTVFEQLEKAHPERAYVHDNSEKFQGFFQCPYGSTEEAGFFADWRRLGGKCWVDPEIQLMHIDGGMRYSGKLGNHLRSKMAPKPDPMTIELTDFGKRFAKAMDTQGFVTASDLLGALRDDTDQHSLMFGLNA